MGSRFVIIGSPRTGSSHLVNLLGAHPEIQCNGNIFHPNQAWVFWPDEHIDASIRAELLEQRRNDPFGFLERVFQADFGRRHVGFKIFEGQQDEVLRKLIAENDVKKIVLYRRNALANFSSKAAAKRTGIFSATVSGYVPEAPKVRFAAKEFVSFHNRYNSFYRNVIDELIRHHQQYHLIHYEEINDTCVFSSLLNFIGADPLIDVSRAEHRKAQVKQNSADICSRFSNPQKVVAFLRRRSLLHWAHEGEMSFENMEEEEPAAQDLAAAIDKGSRLQTRRPGQEDVEIPG